MTMDKQEIRRIVTDYQLSNPFMDDKCCCDWEIERESTSWHCEKHYHVDVYYLKQVERADKAEQETARLQTELTALTAANDSNYNLLLAAQEENARLQAENAKLASELDAAKKANDQLEDFAMKLLKEARRERDASQNCLNETKEQVAEIVHALGTIDLSSYNQMKDALTSALGLAEELQENLKQPNTAKAAAMQEQAQAFQTFAPFIKWMATCDMDIFARVPSEVLEQWNKIKDHKLIAEALRATEGQAEYLHCVGCGAIHKYNPQSKIPCSDCDGVEFERYIPEGQAESGGG